MRRLPCDDAWAVDADVDSSFVMAARAAAAAAIGGTVLRTAMLALLAGLAGA